VKGIVLAGGRGTRLAPLTNVISKQLLPVYDRPMVCYPISALRSMGIAKADIAIITTPESRPQFQKLLGTSYHYIEQEKPNGIGEAPILASGWLNGSHFALVLGDNIFTQKSFKAEDPEYCLIHLVRVRQPERYGCCDSVSEVLIEKPNFSGRWLAVSGLYQFPGDAPEVARSLRPSPRGELEVLDIIRYYQDKQRLTLNVLSGSWFDCGDIDELMAASEMIRSLRQRHNSQLGIIE